MALSTREDDDITSEGDFSLISPAADSKSEPTASTSINTESREKQLESVSSAVDKDCCKGTELCCHKAKLLWKQANARMRWFSTFLSACPLGTAASAEMVVEKIGFFAEGFEDPEFKRNTLPIIRLTTIAIAAGTGIYFVYIPEGRNAIKVYKALLEAVRSGYFSISFAAKMVIEASARDADNEVRINTGVFLIIAGVTGGIVGGITFVRYGKAHDKSLRDICRMSPKERKWLFTDILMRAFKLGSLLALPALSISSGYLSLGLSSERVHEIILGSTFAVSMGMSYWYDGQDLDPESDPELDDVDDDLDADNNSDSSIFDLASLAIILYGVIKGIAENPDSDLATFGITGLYSVLAMMMTLSLMCCRTALMPQTDMLVVRRNRFAGESGEGHFQGPMALLPPPRELALQAHQPQLPSGRPRSKSLP